MFELRHASYVDIDYDVTSLAITLTAFWSANEAQHGGHGIQRAARQYQKFGDEDRLEVGVLETQKSKNPEELSLGGYLTVVGEDKRPSISRTLPNL